MNYATHKETPAGKARTIALKSARQDKYAPRNSSAKNAK